MKLLRPLTAAFLAIGALSFGAGAAQANCVRGNCWGAVAYGPGGVYSYAVNYPDRASASVAARSSGSCYGGRCNSVLTFHNSCGAIAVGDRGGWGWGNQFTAAATQQRALQECAARTTGCRIRVWGCTTLAN
jgi:serine/threonine-protein kinase